MHVTTREASIYRGGADSDTVPLAEMPAGE